MAAAMADCLGAVVNAKQIPQDAVPLGVYHDALEFSRLALQATGSSIPDNPPASLNAYVIAADVLRRSSQELPHTREEVNSRLQQYVDFLQALQTPRSLTDDDRELADSLRSFFARLKEEGESEAYAQTLHFDPVSAGFPVR